MYKAIIRPLFFLISPETAHLLIKTFLRIPGMTSIFRLIYPVRDQRLITRFAGLDFPNPIGLAAGFDKDAEMIKGMESVGFGFIEIGTLTPVGQPGNPKPRLFRLPKDQALINRMGFNNEGVDAAIDRLKKIKNRKIIIGGNLGKNKETPLEKAEEDYRIGFDKLHPYVDYFVVNVSSPNTPNLRKLQDREPLTRILLSLKAKNREKTVEKPILLKIAPDLTPGQLDDIIAIVEETGIAGLVATNTTIGRENLSYDPAFVEALGPGGLSGRPLTKRATEMIRYIREKSNGRIPVMAAGGIMSAADALEKLDAGATLVQLYTGFIYEGPGLIRAINQALLKRSASGTHRMS